MINNDNIKYRLQQNRESAKKSRIKKKEENTQMIKDLEQLQEHSQSMRNKGSFEIFKLFILLSVSDEIQFLVWVFSDLFGFCKENVEKLT